LCLREEGVVDGIEDTWKDDGEAISADIDEFEEELNDDLPKYSSYWWDEYHTVWDYFNYFRW